MKQRQVISVILTLCLLLMACAGSASSHPPVHTKISPEFPVLQLSGPLLFFNGNGPPLHIPSGTYQVTAQAPDTLLLTSTSTGEAHNLHATTMIHTESLTVPYPFLIEEAEGREHVHIVLLLPDGQGLDAEGRIEKIQTRGVGDLTRFAYTPTRQYSGVVMQQGRLTTDTDFNEQESVSSPERPRLHSNRALSHGQVTLEQGHIKLDAEARQALLRRCRFCAGKQ
ncbi:MAG: hypothetical protein KIT39_13515 [Nitrospirales bacterium]|nr:hypothetical protein [Nitrospirales bacterium]